MSKLGGNNITNQPLDFESTIKNNDRLKVEIDYAPNVGSQISHTSLQDIGTNTHVQIDTHIADTANPHAVTKAQVGLSNVDNTSDVNKPVSTAQQTALDLKYDTTNPSGYQTAAQVTTAVSSASTADRARANHTGTQTASTISDFAATVSAQITALKGAINGLASLDGSGKIPTIQLPAIAISDTFVVASQAAQVALTAEIGDIAIRTDLNKSYILRVNDPTVFANWQELLTPTDSVSSVNGQTGAVTLTTTNINEGSNLYFTTARVLATVITGVSFVTNSAILATDTVLQAFGKLQAQLTAVIAVVAGKENTITATTTADYYRGDKTFQPLNKAAVGLGNVDNTSDANKPVSTATQTALNLKYDASNPAGYQTASQVTTTVNAASAADRARANHTGTQSVSTISDFNTTIGTSTQTALDGKSNLAGGNVITGTQDFSNGTIVFDAGGETRFGIGGYTDPDPGTQYNIKYGGTTRSMAVRGQSFFLDQMGIGAQSPVSSAKLEIDSTTQGFLPPRMTSAQRLAIVSPVPGLMVYDTDLCCICTFAETRWIFECDVFTTSVQSSTSTTYANITQLVTSSLEPGLYVFTLRGIAQSTAGPTGIGFRLAQNTATVSNVNISWTFSQAGAGTDKDYEYSQISLADNVSSTGVVAANTNFPISGDGVVRISATGALAVQIRSENGTSVSVRPDTSLVLRKVCE